VKCVYLLEFLLEKFPMHRSVSKGSQKPRPIRRYPKLYITYVDESRGWDVEKTLAVGGLEIIDLPDPGGSDGARTERLRLRKFIEKGS